MTEQTSPPDGECVSDESLPVDVADAIAVEADEARQMLVYAMGADVTADDVELYAKEAQARIDCLLREIEKYREDTSGDGGDSR